MAVLFGGTTLLANWYSRERLVRASAYFEEGERLGKQHELAAAIEAYRNALEISPTSEYRLALAEALIQSGRPEGASAYLAELLRTDIGSGEPNLLLAHIAEKEGKTDAAINYYQRAIYGFWPRDAQANRIAARWELIGLLESAHMEKQVTAQLLELSEQAPSDISLLLDVAKRLLAHNASSQAADIFREVLRIQPKNGAAQAGFAEAELALSQYADAQTAFRKAIRDGDNNEDVRRDYEIVNEVLALDPIRHDLSPLERFRRSLLLLERSAALLTLCMPSPPPDSDVAQLLAEAKQAQSAPVKARDLEFTTDSNIQLAEQLYNARGNCGQTDPALARVLNTINAK